MELESFGESRFIIIEKIKELFCLPTKLRNEVPDIVRNEVPKKYISLNDYIDYIDEKGKLSSNFFIYEVMRLLAFRHLMCIKNNTLSNIEVCLFSSNVSYGDFISNENKGIGEKDENKGIGEKDENKGIGEKDENKGIGEKDEVSKIQISRLDYPVSIHEKSFCFNPDDDACRIPKSVLKKWFDNKPELLYSTVRDLLYDNGFDTEMKLKTAIIDKIKECGVRYDNTLVYWVNSIMDKSRCYL